MYQVDKYTVSLLHFDDGFKDETGKVWTAVGNPKISSDQSKFGGKSLYLDGSSCLSAPNNGDFSFMNGDFTVECWIKRNDYSNKGQSMFELGSDSEKNGNPVGYGFFIGLGHDFKGQFGFFDNNSANKSIPVYGTTIIPVGEWVHIAGVRKNNTLYIFKNGILENTTDCTGGSVNPNPETLANIGTYANNARGNAYSGYIDEFRISNIARWTKDFDPTNSGDGKFLLTITLAEEVEREYPVTKDELDAFIKWYDSRANGTGSVYYTFDKFLNRKDYIVYDKILTFEVTDFSK